MDIIFRAIIQEQRNTWWVRAEGGHHIPPVAPLDCKGILDALQETPKPKFCSLKFDVDIVFQLLHLKHRSTDRLKQDPPGGYWDLNADYAFGRWIESLNPMPTRFKPMELLQTARSDSRRRVDLVVLGPFLNDDGRYWNHVEPKRMTFLDLSDGVPMLDRGGGMVEFATRQHEDSQWVQSREILEIG